MSHVTKPTARRGAILLVVITMLVLFAAVALAFVYYASAEAAGSRYNREAQTSFRPDADPEMLLSYFLGKLIYGDFNDATGVYSALRGHDLARGVYGYPDAGNAVMVGLNTTPFNGLGRVHSNPAIKSTITNPWRQDDYNLINYTYYPSDGFLRDPEHAAFRAGLGTAPNAFVGGANPGWTYVDLNTMCLAAVDANGEALMQSFYRPWAASNLLPLDPNNPNYGNWTTPSRPWLKYQTLRPMPAYNPGFPPPADGGDVKNLEGLPGVPVPGQPGKYYNNDSIWIDIGFPVLTDPTSGRKYKPLFAALVVDLDGKINLNACGNIRGNSTNPPSHLSNQGWGVWEVALWRAMTAAGKQSQWRNLFLGKGTIYGRYGPDGQPSKSGTSPPSGEMPHFNGPGDLDGATTVNASPPTYGPPAMLYLPGDPNNGYGNKGMFLTTPYFPSSAAFLTGNRGPFTYGNGTDGPPYNAFERLNHPSLFNVFTPGGDDRVFSAREMEALLRYYGTGSPAFNSDLVSLCPNDFINLRTRLLLTTHSFDLAKPGAIPWLNPNDPNSAYVLAAGALYPTGGAQTSQTWTTGSPTPQSPIGEYQTERRAATALLGRLDLNKKLPPYPAPVPPAGQINMGDPATAAAFQAAQQARQNMAADIFNRLVWVTTGQQLPTSQAQQKLFFNTLKASIAGRKKYNALRWLAQLAVNIVDYIDSDNYANNLNAGPPGGYSTPFNWDPTDTTNAFGGWVFGVEQPQLVINEVYAEVDNTAQDLQALQNFRNNNVGQIPRPKAFRVNFWVELHNPFKKDPTLIDPLDTTTQYPGAARLSLPPPVAGGPRPPGVYRLIIAQSTLTVHSQLTDPSNTTGDLYTSVGGVKTYLPDVKTIARYFDPALPPAPQPAAGVNTDLVQAADGAFSGSNGNNQGFYVLGAQYGTPGTNPSFPGTNPARPSPTLIVRDQTKPEEMTGQPMESSMTYRLPVGQINLAAPPAHTLVLQRLACPYLPPQGDPTQIATLGYYNPYITVDYVENVPTMNGVLVDPTGAQRKLDWTTMYSVGRKQPYAADSNNLVRQTPDSDNNPANGITPWTDQPQTTLFRHNSVGSAGRAMPAAPPNDPYGANETLTVPFDWFVQQDRILINPIEMLSVSACRPSQVTQLFMNPNPFSHLAPWRDPAARLYRFLEFIETASKGAGVEDGNPGVARRPGMVNINTIWDPEILDALLDPQPSSYFSSSGGVTTANLLKSLLASRTPGGVPGPNDRPFLPLSAPTIAAGDVQYPGGVSINDTVLRPDPADATGQKLLFGVSAAQGPAFRNPQMQRELLQKIFNSITTRSNVFAVWLTVGFFEVTDDTVRPVKLGAEIGKAEGRNVRHRMFAILDRSNVAAPAVLTTTLTPIVAAPTPQQVALGATGGTATAPPPVGVTMNWIIQPGSQIKVDAETVTVQAVVGNTITAVFTQNHNRGAPVGLPGIPGPIPGTVLGNPGPQPRYNPRNNEAVVLHFNIIE
jgi:hypothetical protein